MSFPPLQQLAQEKHHFDKKNDFSSKFNLMKAHGACGFDEMNSIVMKPYKPTPLVKKEHNGVRRASFSMKDVFSSSMFSSKALSRVDEKENVTNHHLHMPTTPLTSSSSSKKQARKHGNESKRVKIARPGTTMTQTMPFLTGAMGTHRQSAFDRVLGDDFISGALCQ
jgi:hypothetical protein